MPNAMPHVRDGRVRGLAVSTPKRLPSAPEFPAIAEALPGFEATAWDGIFVPAGTPQAIVLKLNAAIRQALEDPELAAALLARGAQTAPLAPDAFARYVAASAERWAAAVRSSGAKVD
jgi:tripartite-type tricarboxylate transporter receptor subunit TctC